MNRALDQDQLAKGRVEDMVNTSEFPKLYGNPSREVRVIVNLRRDNPLVANLVGGSLPGGADWAVSRD